MFKERLNPTTTVKAVQGKTPYVFIQADAIAKMQAYVESCPDEIGWLGTAHKHRSDVVIEDVYLFDQEVHSTTTEITPEGLSQFGEELLQREDVDGMSIWNSLKVWGHSHVNMGVTPSAQDNTQMDTFGNSGHDWFIRIIANKKGELKIDLYDYENGIQYHDLPWEELYTAEESALHAQIRELNHKINELKKSKKATIDEPIKEEMKVKVRKKASTIYYGGGKNYSSGQTLSQQQKKTNQSAGGTSATGAKTGNNVKSLSNKYPYTYGYEDDMILCYNDIFDYFEITDLEDFAECSTRTDAKQVASMHGWINTFTDNDLEFLVETARTIFGNNSAKQGQLDVEEEDLKV